MHVLNVSATLAGDAAEAMKDNREYMDCCGKEDSLVDFGSFFA